MRGSELRKLRLRLGLTQPELAKELGVASNTVWRWESGMHRVSPLAERAIRTFIESRKPQR